MKDQDLGYRSRPMPRRNMLRLTGLTVTTLASGELLAACSRPDQKEIEWVTYTSPNFPYRINYPKGWNVDSVGSGNNRLDAFARDIRQATKTMVSVDAKKIDSQKTLSQEAADSIENSINDFLYLGISTRLYKLVGPEDRGADGFNLVAGQYPAYRYTFELPYRQPSHELNSVVFRTNEYVWYAALLCEKGEVSHGLAVFKNMLDSFATRENVV